VDTGSRLPQGFGKLALSECSPTFAFSAERPSCRSGQGSALCPRTQRAATIEEAMFFQQVDEIGGHPRLPGGRPRVFPNTGNLRLAPAERIWASWKGGALGSSRVDLWKVGSTGHSIDLVGARKRSYHLPIRGRMVLEYQDRELRAGTGEGAFLGTRWRRTHVIAPRDDVFEALVVLIPPLVGEEAGDLLRADPAFVAGTNDRSFRYFRTAVAYLFRELSAPDSLLVTERALTAAGAALADLHAHCLVAGAGAPDRVAPASLAQVKAAEVMMRAFYDAPLTMADIAGEIGVGQRALQIAFQRHRGRPPRAVLTTFRLEAARERLRHPLPGDTVSSIALDCGFVHLGRFSLTYRSTFGETPSDTLRRGA
jgi:AraC-like DNA-binding protein